MSDLKNMRYITVNENIKEEEINAPGFKDGTKIMVIRYPVVSFRQIEGPLIVNNKEDYVSEYGCAISKSICNRLGLDINYDAVYLQEE